MEITWSVRKSSTRSQRGMFRLSVLKGVPFPNPWKHPRLVWLLALRACPGTWPWKTERSSWTSARVRSTPQDCAGAGGCPEPPALRKALWNEWRWRERCWAYWTLLEQVSGRRGGGSRPAAGGSKPGRLTPGLPSVADPPARSATSVLPSVQAALLGSWCQTWGDRGTFHHPSRLGGDAGQAWQAVFPSSLGLTPPCRFNSLRVVFCLEIGEARTVDREAFPLESSTAALGQAAP